jgi:dienelactone hydrolase
VSIYIFKKTQKKIIVFVYRGSCNFLAKRNKLVLVVDLYNPESKSKDIGKKKRGAKEWLRVKWFDNY